MFGKKNTVAYMADMLRRRASQEVKSEHGIQLEHDTGTEQRHTTITCAATQLSTILPQNGSDGVSIGGTSASFQNQL